MKPPIKLKPLVKYQGGKTKELSLIQELLPSYFTRVVEPFCGGAAVSFALDYPALMCDLNKDVINLYSVVADDTLYPRLQEKVNDLKTLEHNDLEKEFYIAREVINNSWDYVNVYDRALSYIIVRQLCFSGMERYNSKGKFNVPFGHYQRFSCNLSLAHHQFLKTKCNFKHETFAEIFPQIKNDDFIFIDPPYLERLGYIEGDGGLKLHKDLLCLLQSTTAKWMIIHSEHEFYRDSYKDYNVLTKDFLYAQRFGKDKNHSGAKVSHLYIRNYETNNT